MLEPWGSLQSWCGALQKALQGGPTPDDDFIKTEFHNHKIPSQACAIELDCTLPGISNKKNLLLQKHQKLGCSPANPSSCCRLP